MEGPQAPNNRPAFYVRAIVVGALMGVVINLWVPYSAYVLHSSRIVFGYVPMCVLMPFVLLLLFINPLLKLLNRRFVLRPDELTIIFVMMLVSSVFPTLGLIGFLLAMMATPYYFASVENQWAENIHQYIPRWAFPSDAGGAMRCFFDGLPPGESIPWQPWVIPLCWWMLFIIAFFVGQFCLMQILRRQWVERERLTFPLVEVPQLMVAGADDDRGLLPAFTRSRLFWIGAALPFCLIAWNVIGFFYPEFPAIPCITSRSYLRLGRNMPAIFVKINFFVIAFAFFTNLDVLFSVWFFHVVIILQIGIMRRFGYDIGSADLWCSFDAATGWQSFGGFMFLVLWGLWMARKHIRDVLRKAWDPSIADVNDSDELITYRAAVLGVVFSLVFIAAWLRQMGMGYLVMAFYIFGAMILHLGVSKIVAQCGLVYVRGTLTAQSFTMRVLGTASISPASLSSLAFTFCYCCDAKSAITYNSVHTGKAFAGSSVSRRVVLVSLVIACIVGIVVSIWITLRLGYSIGAYNFGAWETRSGNIRIFNNVVSKMRNPTQPDWRRIGFLAGGVVATVLLTILHYNVSWWRLHPVGFTIGGIWPIRASAFAIFIAWALKFVLVKLGGISLYRKAKPFVLGTLVGYVMSVVLAFVVDMIWFPGQGHAVHVW
ncbi:MAG: hypothetical protein GXP25_13190 [Planctomycetes bacterium]|nr:hypothetical protein [Planctomycetota bacterium]